MRKLMLYAVLCAALPAPVQAFTVTNLSGQPQQIVVDEGGAQTPVTLAPGQVYRRSGGDVMVLTPTRDPVQAKFDEEYAIWPNGMMYIQKRQRNKGQAQ